MKSRPKMILPIAVAVLTVVLLPGLAAAKKQKGGPVVLAPESEIANVRLQDWPAWLLKSYLESPADAERSSGGRVELCLGQPQDVVFLPPALGPDRVTWTCTINPETVVVVTLRDTWSVGLPTDPDANKTQGYLRKAAKCADKKSKIKATLNGKNVPRSRFLFVGAANGTAGDDLVNVDLPVGSVPVAVKGHYLAITDFPPGKHRFTLRSEGCSGSGFDDQDVILEFHVTR